MLALQTVATGPEAQIQIRLGTAAAFRFDTELHRGSPTAFAPAVRLEGRDPGAYANRLRAEARPASTGTTFDLLLSEDGVFRERWVALSMDRLSPRYVETVINHPRRGSKLVRATDVNLPNRPVPAQQTVAFVGGDDGLAELDDNDFIGSPTAKSGLYAFDVVQDVATLLVPGRATPAVHNAMITYCELTRGGMVFAVLDPPADASAEDIVAYVSETAALEGLSEFGAIYWPRALIRNPAPRTFGASETIVAAPSGIIAGVYARNDAARPGGVYEAPAGIENGRMLGVLGFENEECLDEKKRDLVYPHRVNPLTTGTGFPRYIDGSRTLKGNGDFPFIGERRGVIFLEKSLRRGLEFARHKNNTPELRARIFRISTTFLLTQMGNGAFRSKDPAKAFFVDCSDALNKPSVVMRATLLVEYGFATNKPAEFVVLRVEQATMDLDVELAAAGVEG